MSIEHTRVGARWVGYNSEKPEKLANNIYKWIDKAYFLVIMNVYHVIRLSYDYAVFVSIAMLNFVLPSCAFIN